MARGPIAARRARAGRTEEWESSAFSGRPPVRAPVAKIARAILPQSLRRFVRHRYQQRLLDRFAIDERTLVNYCEYLTFRSFYTGFEGIAADAVVVREPHELREHIARELSGLNNPALLLSSGMDSAILAPYMPKGSVAYTIYHEELEKNELDVARFYCEKFGLVHRPIRVLARDYFEVIGPLMATKKMPLSPAEPILHLAARVAKRDGHAEVVTGGGADTRCGGFRKLRKNVRPEKFAAVLRDAYLKPWRVLKASASVDHVFERFTGPEGVVDARAFLRHIGVELFAFDNAINSAGVRHVAPFVTCVVDFDETRNRKQEKYVIAEAYREIYGCDAPKKWGLQKPTYLLKDYRPTHPFFQAQATEGLDYPRKFLVYCLEQFEFARNPESAKYRSARRGPSDPSTKPSTRP